MGTVNTLNGTFTITDDYNGNVTVNGPATAVFTYPVVAGNDGFVQAAANRSAYEFCNNFDIRFYNKEIESVLTDIENTLNGIESDIRVLKQRGEDESVGIVVRQTCNPCIGGFERAVLVNALRQGEQLENVVKEVNNPTPLPKLRID